MRTLVAMRCLTKIQVRNFFILGLLSRPAAGARLDEDRDSQLGFASSYPPDLDWSLADANPMHANLVSPVPKQGKCNSGWVWAALGSIESRWAIFNKLDKVVPLSAQQAIDCVGMVQMMGKSRTPSSYGRAERCTKGELPPVMLYAIEEGFMTAEAYPVQYDVTGSVVRDSGFSHVTVDRQCEISPYRKVDDIAVKFAADEWKVRELGWNRFRSNWNGGYDSFEESAIAALQDGPVGFGISKASRGLLFDPATGVATSDSKCGAQVDHFVLLVGYGTAKSNDGTKTKYWKLRNSFGSAWGDNGYFKIPRGRRFCATEAKEDSGSFLDYAPKKKSTK